MDLEKKVKRQYKLPIWSCPYGDTSRASCDHDWRRKIHISICMLYNVISRKTYILWISSWFKGFLWLPIQYFSMYRCLRGKIYGMKCYYCHVFLHRFLPLSIRGVLRNEVCETLIELSSFFRELSSKTLSLNTLHLLEKSIVLTLCKLKKIFPPFWHNGQFAHSLGRWGKDYWPSAVSLDGSNWKIPL